MQYLVYAKDDIKWGQHWHISKVLSILEILRNLFFADNLHKKQSYYLNQLFELLDYQSKSIPFSGSKTVFHPKY